MAKNTAVALGSTVLYIGSKGTKKVALVIGTEDNFVPKETTTEFCEDCQEDHTSDSGRPALAEGELILRIFSISGKEYTQRVSKSTGAEGETQVWTV